MLFSALYQLVVIGSLLLNGYIPTLVKLLGQDDEPAMILVSTNIGLMRSG